MLQGPYEHAGLPRRVEGRLAYSNLAFETTREYLNTLYLLDILLHSKLRY